MTKQRRYAGTVAELIKRGKDEVLRLLSDGEIDEPAVLRDLEILFDDWKHGRPLTKDNRDFLMFVLEGYQLRVAKGRPFKSPQAKADEAAAFVWGREQLKRLKVEGVEAPERLERVARDMKERKYPALFRNTKLSVIKDRLRRRPKRN